jgi:hypothetical protein
MVTTDTDTRILRTWGEIADYLGVSIKTARRYRERNQLPVYKLDEKKPVYAFTEELDLWLRNWRGEYPGDKQATLSLYS